MNAAGRSTGDAYGHALLSVAASDERTVSVEGGRRSMELPVCRIVSGALFQRRSGGTESSFNGSWTCSRRR